jgi:hypothetical protein
MCREKAELENITNHGPPTVRLRPPAYTYRCWLFAAISQSSDKCDTSWRSRLRYIATECLAPVLLSVNSVSTSASPKSPMPLLRGRGALSCTNVDVRGPQGRTLASALGSQFAHCVV